MDPCLQAARFLPPHLLTRARRLNDCPVRNEGKFVLCWLHHAIRDHENPALDVAVTLGNAIGRPVLVYQGLAGRHRFNSDRHHVFIMEGARDLQAGLADRGIAYAFHLPQDLGAPSPLFGLLDRASVLVTEDFPAPPFPRWTARWASVAQCAAVGVDSACIMPLRLLKKRYTRAFAFRKAAQPEWSAHLREPWADAEPKEPQIKLNEVGLGFKPIDLEQEDLPALAATCTIDHATPPVQRIAGGSASGYARWDDFRTGSLRRYDNRRNDAADMEAVSGLSPYLHHGHVSPFRIAREANALGGKGSEKFLDKLLVWRELAFNFCVHTPEEELGSLGALPDWALRTLGEHADDQRDATYSWETLARGTTGSELWNLAQRSLVQNGELHNNLRMTWGKAIAAWSRSPEVALRNLIDLNHRYALDGSDPNSYGGLLWCLGQFDRPFSPEQPVLGTVRGRSVEQHAERLSPPRYAAAVEARWGFDPIRVAVVGGGVSGLACARVLQEQGCPVTVFDRGRGPGGRMATHIPRDADSPEFDHGAPYFTVLDPRFGRYVRSWIEGGVCDRWTARQGRWVDGVLEAVETEAPLIVGKPSMTTLCGHLAADLNLQVSSTVTAIRRDADGWTLACDGDQDHGRFDAVVLAMAPEQAARLAGTSEASFDAELGSLSSIPVWAGLFGVIGLSDELPDDLEVVGDEAIDRIIRNERKPGRVSTGALTVHARSDWSAARHDVDREVIAAELAEHTRRILSDVTGRTVEPDCFSHSRAHRWGLARPAESSPQPCLFDRAARLVVCGDGFGGSGVEAAFLSGRAAAGRVLSLRPPRANEPATAGTESLFEGETQ